MGQGNVESWEEEPNRLTRTLWNGLIRRVCPKRDEAEGEEKEEGKVRICRKRFYWEEDPTRSALEKKKVAVRDLAAILRLMDNPRLLLLDLLELIFERFGEDEEAFGAEYLQHNPDLETPLFQLSCPQHGSHVVSPLGFLLLDTNAVLICSYRKYRKNCK